MSLFNRNLHGTVTYEGSNMNVIQGVKIEVQSSESDQVGMARQVSLLSSTNKYWWAQEIS